ncbi:flagellar basal body P-ring formation chaperone FlgA [Undibacterium arcticum]|uniref:Flagella basal body P-ring formation protein FlgA n=1 Tax=Undibacterium arcticum TaxID=1762892 RepID=A0ABV7F5Q4_9BURK
MKILFKASLALCLMLLLPAAIAQTSASRQDPAAIRQSVEQFLAVQTAGLPGQVSVVVGPIDNRTNLASCAEPQPFLPNGSRAWGKTTVGVRCTAPTPWIIYVQAKVAVTGDYYATAAPLAQGQVIGNNDLIKQRGELSALPTGIITDATQAIGKSMTVSLAAGTPLRLDALRSQLAIQQGQMVRLVSSGAGFQVSAEVRALTSATEGQVVQVRTQSGQQISGVARSGGVVEVAY